jgi:Protein of unknown function (DUF2569)
MEIPMTNACAIAPPELRGIGGWLFFPMLGTILAPVLFMHEFFYHVDVLANNPDISLQWKIFVRAEIIAAGLMAAGWIFAAFMLFQHKRIYPTLFVGLLIASFVLSLTDIVVAAQWFGAATEDPYVRNTLRPLILLVIWGPYMFRSERVKNTFVYP